MQKLSDESLLSLLLLVSLMLFIKIILDVPFQQFLIFVGMSVSILLVSRFLLDDENGAQLVPISIGFTIGFGINSLLSARYLAEFTAVQKYYIIGYVDGFAFVQDPLFISLTVSFILFFIILRSTVKNLTISQKLIFVFFGFSVVSLVFAGLKFTTIMLEYLPMVAENRIISSAKLRFDASVFMDVLKSLFFAGLFNVLEKIVTMRTDG